MAKLAQRATAAIQRKRTLVSSHLNGFVSDRAKVFPGRDSPREGGRMTAVKDATGSGGVLISSGALRTPSFGLVDYSRPPAVGGVRRQDHSAWIQGYRGVASYLGQFVS